MFWMEERINNQEAGGKNQGAGVKIINVGYFSRPLLGVLLLVS